MFDAGKRVSIKRTLVMHAQPPLIAFGPLASH
jgi:hypothetical protein